MFNWYIHKNAYGSIDMREDLNEKTKPCDDCFKKPFYKNIYGRGMFGFVLNKKGKKVGVFFLMDGHVIQKTIIIGEKEGWYGFDKNNNFVFIRE